MSKIIGYSREELRQVLNDLLAERHITYEHALQEAEGKFQPQKSGILNLDTSKLVPGKADQILHRDLLNTLVDILPELIAKNNQKLIEDIRSTNFPQ